MQKSSESFHHKHYRCGRRLAERVSAPALAIFLALCAPFQAHAVALSTENLVATPSTMRNEQTAQKTLQELESQTRDIKYIRELVYPLLQRSVKFCNNVTTPFIGVFFANRHDISADIKAAAIKKYDLDDQFKVVQTLAGFPADQQGILVDDILFAVNDTPFPYGENALPTAYKLLHSSLQLNIPSKITVIRRGTKVALSITPVSICNFPVTVSNSSQALAYATGETISVSRGMLTAGESNNHLVAMITHALAHNVLGHPSTQSKEQYPDNYSLLSAIAGLSTLTTNLDMKPYSPAFELEADYVGLNLMSMSNYTASGAPRFFKKMAADKSTNSIWSNWQIRHPMTDERITAMDQNIDEIQQRRQSGTITFSNFTELEKLREIRHARQFNADETNQADSKTDEAQIWADKSFKNLQAKNWQQVIRTSTNAIALDPKFDIPYINRGLAYIESGSPEKGIEDANTAILLNPVNAKAYNNRGYAFQLLGKLDYAKRDFRKACELREEAGCLNFKEMTGYRLDNVQVDLNLLLETSYAKFAAKQWRSVVEITSDILNIDPNHTAALVNRAGAYAEQGLYKEALTDCEKALSIDPDFAAAHHNRGYVYELMGKIPEAIVNYQTSCSMGIEASCTEAKRLLK